MNSHRHTAFTPCLSQKSFQEGPRISQNLLSKKRKSKKNAGSAQQTMTTVAQTLVDKEAVVQKGEKKKARFCIIALDNLQSRTKKKNPASCVHYVGLFFLRDLCFLKSPTFFNRLAFGAPVSFFFVFYKFFQVLFYFFLCVCSCLQDLPSHLMTLIIWLRFALPMVPACKCRVH